MHKDRPLQKIQDDVVAEQIYVLTAILLLNITIEL